MDFILVCPFSTNIIIFQNKQMSCKIHQFNNIIKSHWHLASKHYSTPQNFKSKQDSPNISKAHNI